VKNSALLLAVALSLAGLIGPARADEAASGREVYELRCRTCHGGAKADSPIGPSLHGISPLFCRFKDAGFRDGFGGAFGIEPGLARTEVIGEHGHRHEQPQGEQDFFTHRSFSPVEF